MPQDAYAMSSEKPLQGAVICCTSIPPEVRTRLTEYAEQMGAEHRLDLTSDVTHLLVGETGTPKYQYVAKEREDVKVLQPDWVEAVRQCWMADQTLDLNTLDAAFTVPILAGLKICITGFDDLTFRAQLQENIKKNGGLYTGDLTKDVTHLIAATAEGKKYEYASLWQKKIVGLKWYKDTLARGMQLDESLYHPSKPVEEQGIGAWNREQDRASILGKRQQRETPAQEPSRKLRRTASAKFGSQSDSLWQDISRGQGAETTSQERDTLRPSKSMPAMRANSFANEADSQSTSLSRTMTGDARIFEGTHFALHGFDARRNEVLVNAIQGLGAIVHSSVPELLDLIGLPTSHRFLLVPHQTRKTKFEALKEIENDLIIVNELWVEWCIQVKRMVPVEEYPLGNISESAPSTEVSRLFVNATGFHPVQTMHIAKAVTSLGAKYEEVFTPKHSVLVCHSSNVNPQKALHAMQWKIPIVSEKWLWQLVMTGQVPPFETFMIRQRPRAEDDFQHRKRTESLTLKKKSPSPKASFHTQDTLPVPSHSEKDLTPGSPSQPPEPTTATAARSMPLKEVSPNLSPKKNPANLPEGKKKLFRTFDGASSAPGEEAPKQNPASATEDLKRSSISPVSNQGQDPIAEFLQIKAQAAAKAAENGDPPAQPCNRGRLLGRVLSNLSNASLASKGVRNSRASSIDSMNTDGLGTELSNSTVPPWSNAVREESPVKNSFGFTGRAKPKSTTELPLATHNAGLIRAIGLNDPMLLRDEYAEEDLAPQRTQLGYEESEEAIAMREKLSEKRRARGRVDQKDAGAEPAASKKEKRVIRDDEALLGRGGRRTRQKDRAAKADATTADDFAL